MKVEYNLTNMELRHNKAMLDYIFEETGPHQPIGSIHPLDKLCQSFGKKYDVQISADIDKTKTNALVVIEFKEEKAPIYLKHIVDKFENCTKHILAASLIKL